MGASLAMPAPSPNLPAGRQGYGGASSGRAITTSPRAPLQPTPRSGLFVLSLARALNATDHLRLCSAPLHRATSAGGGQTAAFPLKVTHLIEADTCLPPAGDVTK